MQIRTIEELLAGQSFHMPPTNITLAQAERVKEQGRRQGKLLSGEARPSLPRVVARIIEWLP